MAKYSNRYLLSHCVDLFFKFNEKYVHILTDGAFIPLKLNDRERNRRIQSDISLLEPDDLNLGIIEVNPFYLHNICHLQQDDLLDENRQREVLQMFAPLAQLGFVSYYCMSTNGGNGGRYIWVARPIVDNIDGALKNLDIPVFDEILQPEYDNEGNLIEMTI